MNGKQLSVWIALVGYVAFLATLIYSLYFFHNQVITDLGSPQAIADWQTWKEGVVKEQSQENKLVKRRLPTSDVPPMLYLMQNHFVVISAFTIVIGSFLYGFFVLTLRGIVFSPGSADLKPDVKPTTSHPAK